MKTAKAAGAAPLPAMTGLIRHDEGQKMSKSKRVTLSTCWIWWWTASPCRNCWKTHRQHDAAADGGENSKAYQKQCSRMASSRTAPTPCAYLGGA
ncbi:hypothetical protein KCP73_09050 [Salmonella enterica subsp. enterica]|nr:hypothetical protein KCP73_09050 [Salmonella enterica subsp. enterica]